MSEDVTYTETIPDWFNLDSYTPIKNMSYQELAAQLHYRIHTLMVMNSGALGYFNDFDYFDEIYKNGVIIPESKGAKQYSNWIGQIKSSGRRLSESLAIKPINRSELGLLSIQRESSGDISKVNNSTVGIILDEHLKDDFSGEKIALDEKYILWLLENDKEKFHRVENESIDLLLNNNNKIHVNIDLSLPDKFIIEGLKKLLSDWRKQLSIPKPNPKLKSSLKLLRSNIINYRAFQIIDLKLWAKSKSVRHTESFLHETIFPDIAKPLNLDDFRKKAIPFSSDILDPRLPPAILDSMDLEEKN
ncbi:DUF6387 family protein [Providencia rettgeri]